MPLGWPEWLLAVLLGLIVGSFLNVLIHRLPRMLEAAWEADHAAWLLVQQDVPGHHPATQQTAQRFDLWLPASHCPACNTPLRWVENVPLLGYLWLRGRCAHCGARISPRYPLVEWASAALAADCAWRYGLTLQALAWFGFGATLLSLALIDWDTTYLPDSLTLPLLWAGLLAAAAGLTITPLPQAVWGDAIGYASLRLVYEIFLRLTGREGMGHGDFKLYAAIGAWLGWPALLPVLLVASVSGLVVGLMLNFSGRLGEQGQLPFGPFLALGGARGWILGSNWLLQLLAQAR